jgi:hypothetical protein
MPIMKKPTQTIPAPPPSSTGRRRFLLACRKYSGIAKKDCAALGGLTAGTTSAIESPQLGQNPLDAGLACPQMGQDLMATFTVALLRALMARWGSSTGKGTTAG